MRHKLPPLLCISQTPLMALIIVAPFLLQTAILQASPQTVVSVEPRDISVGTGQSFSVNITIADVQNLYGLEVTLSWNSSVLQVVNIDDRLGQTDGALNNPIYVAENSTQENSYVISATSTSPAPPFNGTGNMAKITFTVTNTGDSKLGIEAQLYDYPPPDRDPRISLPIAHTTIDGFFHSLVPEFSGSAILVILMMLTFTAAIFSKKDRMKKPFHLH
jgi:hypothetical protein